MPSNVVITGAAGFIGYHLARYYLLQKKHVLGLDNFITGQKAHVEKLKTEFPELFQFIEFDVTSSWENIHFINNNEFSLLYFLSSPAAPFDYAKFSVETMLTNSVGLKNAIEFCDLKSLRLIFASTSEVYGQPLVSPQSENYWGNVNPYGDRSCYDEAKRFGESLIYTMNKKNKTEHGIVRIFNTYGPHMKLNDGRAVINFLYQAMNNLDITLMGDGQQTRSFCYIDDLIEYLVRYGASRFVEPFNIGNDQEISIYELLQIILKLTNSKSLVKYIQRSADDPLQRKPDLSKARNYLHYSPQIEIAYGLQKLMSHLDKK